METDQRLEIVVSTAISARRHAVTLWTLFKKNSEKIWTYISSRSSKVDDFGTNRKRICDFLLVINSNFGPILNRFWDTATYWLKIAYFSYPSLIRRPRSLSSLWNFTVKLSVRKLVMGYSVVKVVHRLWLIHPCDGQTDRQTDGRWHIARYMKELLKSVHICRSYCKNKSGTFFYGPRCSLTQPNVVGQPVPYNMWNCQLEKKFGTKRYYTVSMGYIYIYYHY